MACDEESVWKKEDEREDDEVDDEDGDVVVVVVVTRADVEVRGVVDEMCGGRGRSAREMLWRLSLMTYSRDGLFAGLGSIIAQTISINLDEYPGQW